MDVLSLAVVFLGAAFISVPLAKRLKVDATLGYLACGVALGPYALGTFDGVDQIFQVAELGVVLLLFVIGLELQPARLWTMRRAVFGLGSAQMAASTLIIGIILTTLGLEPVLAGLIAVMVSASSTPMALQILTDRRELTMEHGRTAFAVMLFQDLTAIPLFAIIPLLGAGFASADPIISAGKIALQAGVLLAFIFGGRFVLQQVLRVVAQVQRQDAFTATTLFTVAASAWAMSQVDLSPALGAFLAGMLLADSSYRHELAANIEPFKSLLLSLLFVAVGMSINLTLLVHQPLTILSLVATLVLVKAGVMFALARAWKLEWRASLTTSIVLSQGGEFAFALLILAFSSGLMDAALLDQATLVVGLSMITTPLLLLLADALLTHWERMRGKDPAYDPVEDVEEEADAPVIIAGFGRMGQIVARILRARGESFTALEPNLDQVELARRFGSKVYFGDPARLDLLRAAGVEHARLFIITLEDMDHSLKVAEVMRQNFPHVPLYSRARNRLHVHKLMDMGVTVIERETFHSGLELATKVLRGIGYAKADAEDIVKRFRRHDENHLYLSHANYKNEKVLIQHVKRQADVLAAVLADDNRLNRDK